MSRRQELENMVIGTLLESTEEKNYYPDCGCIITEDMMMLDANRRIYSIITEMNMNGKHDTRPTAIYEEYGEHAADLLPHMIGMCVEYSIIAKRAQYNQREHIEWCRGIKEPKYTAVEFSDYVKAFIRRVYDEERRQGNKVA